MSLVVLDTQLLFWGLGFAGRHSVTARAQIADPSLSRAFSVVSIWEVGETLLTADTTLASYPGRIRLVA